MTSPALLLFAVPGAVMVALAALVVRMDPGRRGNRVFGALFGTWGLAVVVGGGAVVGGDAAVVAWSARIWPVLMLALPAALAYFALTYPRPRAEALARHGAWVPFAAAAVVPVAAYLADPGLFWDVDAVVATGWGDPRGPLYLWGVRGTELVAAVAAVGFVSSLVNARSRQTRRQLVLVSAGLLFPAACGCAVAAFSSRVLGGELFAPRTFQYTAPWLGGLSDAVIVVQIALITAAVVVAAAVAVRRRRRDLGRAALLYLWFVVLAVASANVALRGPAAGLSVTQLAMVAWAWIAFAGTGVIAYGLLMYQIFDIDLKVKAGLRRSVVAGAFLGVFFLTSEAVELIVSGVAGALAGLVAAGLLALALRPLERQADRIADRIMPGVEDSAAYRQARKEEVYARTLAEVLGDGELSPSERLLLENLRERMGIDPGTARRLERRVRTGHAP